jgi:tRNA (adenine22-N1)-methyltransferase
MLSRRLSAIAEYVQDCDTLLDVGSDHGLLPYWLLKQNRIRTALVSDVREEPLKQAQHTLKSFDSSRVRFYLSDGLRSIDEPFDTCVIAGMGSPNIQNILVGGLEKAKKAHRILLQSNSGLSVLRQFMVDHQFELKDERLVKERAHFYVIMHYAPSHHKQFITPSECVLGTVLQHQNSVELIMYYQHLLNKELRIIRGRRLTSTPNYEILSAHLTRLKESHET